MAITSLLKGLHRIFVLTKGMDSSSRFWILFSAVGVAAGASGGGVFLVAFQNYHAGAWAALSCFPASAVCHLHYRHHKGRFR